MTGTYTMSKYWTNITFSTHAMNMANINIQVQKYIRSLQCSSMQFVRVE